MILMMKHIKAYINTQMNREKDTFTSDDFFNFDPRPACLSELASGNKKLILRIKTRQSEKK